MKIELNGRPHTTSAQTLAELCNDQGFADTKVATALNGTFVPTDARVRHALNDGDKIEIVAPRQGG